MSWRVPARVVRVIDGDTVEIDLDLGWRVYRNRERLRIAGLFCPERNTVEGKVAKGAAEELLPVGSQVFVTSEAKPSFERTVGSIELADGRDFAGTMISRGLGTATPPPK